MYAMQKWWENVWQQKCIKNIHIELQKLSAKT